jgi:DNA mismatch endonuclease (patch repair protein)
MVALVRTKTTDIFPPEKRSAIMRAVKAESTGLERRLFEAMRRAGLSPKRNVKSLPGSPDFVFTRVRLAVFTHGCFWHGHDCPRGRRAPKTNAAYWSAKIARNMKRDRKVARDLRGLGYCVSTLWECRVKEPDRAARRVERRIEALSAGRGAPRGGKSFVASPLRPRGPDD